LVDTEGNATAYDFSLRVYNGTDPANSKISITESENAGAAALESTVTPGFEWFDASSPAQLSTSLIDADSPDGIVYKFSGFSPTDFVNFKFVLGINGIGNGDLDVGGGPEGTLFTSGQPGRTFLASGLDTASTGFYLDRTVTGFSSYEVFLGKTIDGDGSAASAINAMQILVVPELSAFVLMEIAFLPIILGLCLRKYFAALVFRKDAVKG
nr:hypothetical protein [Kiritimatiellia bacterium]